VSLVDDSRRGAVGLVRLNRPAALNALSDEMMKQLVAALERCDRDPQVRCIVIAGDDAAFAAGADIGELAGCEPVDLLQGPRVARWDALRRCSTPLVAAVSGWCLGGGCELALGCDLIVASDSAVFGLPETGLGVIPGAGGTQRLVRAVGKATAMDMVLTGRTLSAREAHAAGLVARVVDRSAWLERALAVAAEIAARAPIAQRLARESIDRAFETTLETGLDLERKALLLAFATDDAREGLVAFIERREPRWASS